MAARKCLKCGCSELLFNPETQHCVRQGCCCTSCVFEQPTAPADVADLGKGVSTSGSVTPSGGTPAVKIN